MKKLAMVLLALALCLAMTVPALAAELPRVVDRADLLTDAQEEELLEELDQISARHWADVVVEQTVEAYGLPTAEEFTRRDEGIKALLKSQNPS